MKICYDTYVRFFIRVIGSGYPYAMKKEPLHP